MAPPSVLRISVGTANLTSETLPLRRRGGVGTAGGTILLRLGAGAARIEYPWARYHFMSGFVDLHSHYLPAIDDGAKTLAMGLQMVSAVADLGFEWLCATPHQRAGMYMPSGAAMEAAFAQVKAELSARPDTARLRIDLAAENFWDDVFADRLQNGGLPTYPGGKAFLFEVEIGNMPPRIEDTLFKCRLGGRLPVMAHPERYRAVQEDPSRAEALGRSAALLVDLAALDGAYGRPQKKTARKLLEDGLVHAVTTDIHAPEDARAVAAGMDWIRKRLGAHTLARLLADHPRRILAGELPVD